QTFSVAENVTNGTAIGTVLATDPEEDNLMFSITAGNTGDVFDINRTTGAITTAGALDFENNPYTLAVKVSDGKLSGTANITINVEPPAADFTVSSTNTMINIDGLANVYTVDVETTLMNWTITSSDNDVIPASQIQKMSDSHFVVVVGEYPATETGTSRDIMLTLSGTGGSDLVLTVTQTKNTASFLDSKAGLNNTLGSNDVRGIEFYIRGFSQSEQNINIFFFSVNGTNHNYSVSVSPPNRIRLSTPVTDVSSGILTFFLTPPSAGNTEYAIITLTSITDPAQKVNLVIILPPPS
ncbi:MAG: cadherin repeat domain-containing protein, partial [Ekhidna sp.]|nr:cadherin repeat domain-containing protein [Ekhidna sp.]